MFYSFKDLLNFYSSYIFKIKKYINLKKQIEKRIFYKDIIYIIKFF